MRPLARAHDRFKILFCGRDEFSCLVLNELHRAKGGDFTLKQGMELTSDLGRLVEGPGRGDKPRPASWSP